MNQPNYLNWPQYDDDLVNKAYVDALGKDINIKEVRQELNTISGNVTTLSTTKLDNSVFNNFITTQYNPLVSNVDAKIESFYQNTDPSTTWSTLLEKSTHKGDIWYDTSSQRTYVYYEDTTTSPTSYYWQWQNVPTSLINTVDGKAVIYVGSTTPSSPNEGDLWFKSVDEGIYTYVNNSWQEYNKYTDDTAANEAIDKAEDALSDIATLSDDVHTNYTTSQTFNNITGILSTRVGVVETDYVKTTTLNQKSDEFEIAIKNAQDTADEASGGVGTINTTLNNYFTFANDGLTLGISNSNMKLKITNQSIQFLDGNTVIASWSRDGSSGETKSLTSLNLGNFIFKPRTNGSLDLRHI